MRRWWFGCQSNKAGQSSANSTVQKWGKQSELEHVVYASCGSGVTLGIKWLLEAVQRLPHSRCGGGTSRCAHCGCGEGSHHLHWWGSKCGAHVVIDPGRKHKLWFPWALWRNSTQHCCDRTRAAFIGRRLSVIRAHRCRKVLINSLAWWSWISIPIKFRFWLSSWKNIMFLFNNRESALMWRVDMLSKFWTALSLLSFVFVISK